MTTEGTTSEPTGGPEQPAPPAFRPLLRSRNDRVLAGVAGGLGHWLDVDPVIFRVTFAVLTLFGGVGVIAYLIGYLLIPDEATGEALVSGRLVPDLRRLTQQQRALLGWGTGGIFVLIAIGGHRSTTVAVLIIVAAVAVLTARSRSPRVYPSPFAAPSANAPSNYGQQNDYSYSPPPGSTVPPSAAFTAPGEPATAWQPHQSFYVPRAPAPAPRYVVKSRGRRLNRVLLSATVLVVGIYLMLGSAGAYDPTVLQATAVGLTALGLGLAGTAWYARSRGALVIGVLLTAFLMAGSAVQGDYGTAVGNRTWRPTATAVIPAVYKLGAGDATLDLSQLGTAAQGRTIKVNMGAGKLRVLVPDNLAISAYAHINVGSYKVFGENFDGDPVRQTVATPGWTQATGIRIEAQLRVGNVEVEHG